MFSEDEDFRPDFLLLQDLWQTMDILAYEKRCIRRLAKGRF